MNALKSTNENDNQMIKPGFSKVLNTDAKPVCCASGSVISSGCKNKAPIRCTTYCYCSQVEHQTVSSKSMSY